ncbi:pilus assembly protein PilW [Corticibacter populi]|uniref:Pilus assembly protein PilW n=1 Tax=Corticibacter populi TaxID=1550736 RepID=A0A3M6QKP5_9BURK|nr:PilW family protein [Corticibacter populi]RMX03032.1 pilus assembly protein PilW [Corticibacter populi]RZS33466.1 type IV pilus assembly protein PilW [Corticibacter populi]
MSLYRTSSSCLPQPVNGAHGVSLVELLVGMAIGLLTVLVITQVFLVSEQYRRIPTSGANAHVNGVLALDALQRDIRQAGYGLGPRDWLGCQTEDSSDAAKVGLSGTVLAPVVITPGDSDHPSDAVTVLASGSSDAAMPIQLAEDHAVSGTAFITATAAGLSASDWMLVTDGSTCEVFQLGSITTIGSQYSLGHASGMAAFADGSVLSDLGAIPVYRRWSIDADRAVLQMTDLATTAPSAVDAYPEIVLMRALYGKDTNSDATIDTYEATQPSVSDWGNVLAVRLVLVARSPHYDKEAVTTDAPEWVLGSATVSGAHACNGDAESQCLSLDLEHVGDDWQHYRYQLLDTMIPMRNLLWNAG